jgi:hypothetical protein
MSLLPFRAASVENPAKKKGEYHEQKRTHYRKEGA